MTREKSSNTSSWENVGGWYGALVGREGHYYHRQIIMPGLLKLLGNLKGKKLLDLACGQGILSRHLPPTTSYSGVDISPKLIAEAKQLAQGGKREFFVGDVTAPLAVAENHFDHIVMVLALQNVADLEGLCANVQRHLAPGGHFTAILNHPCFRIARQSSWGVDEGSQLQYRRVDSYMTPMQIPIQMHPGAGVTSAQTISFHYPLHVICGALCRQGLYVNALEEWCSDKQSIGKTARRENRARAQIPLFMALQAKKVTP